jgi:hypothetical protein
LARFIRSADVAKDRLSIVQAPHALKQQTVIAANQQRRGMILSQRAAAAIQRVEVDVARFVVPARVGEHQGEIVPERQRVGMVGAEDFSRQLQRLALGRDGLVEFPLRAEQVAEVVGQRQRVRVIFAHAGGYFRQRLAVGRFGLGVSSLRLAEVCKVVQQFEPVVGVAARTLHALTGVGQQRFRFAQLVGHHQRQPEVSLHAEGFGIVGAEQLAVHL